MNALPEVTPPGMQLDDIAGFGLLIVFGGLFVYILLGWIIGSLTRFEFGAGITMMLFGLAAVAAAAWVAAFAYNESVAVILPRASCEPLPSVGDPPEPRSRNRYALERKGQTPRTLATPALPRVCPEQAEPPMRLRVRKSEIAGDDATPATATPEEDSRYPMGLIGMFGAFGAFGLLGGTILLSSAGKKRRAAKGVAPRAPKPVSPAVTTFAESLSTAGTLAAIGGFIACAFVDDTVRAFQFAFNGIALACASYFVSFLLQRKLTVQSTATLLLIGGGFWMAGAAIRYFA